MKTLGILLLIGSFGWLLLLTGSFTGSQYGLWIHQSQQWGDSETLPTDVATSAIRDICIKLNAAQKSTRLPAVGMLLGGLLLALPRWSDLKIRDEDDKQS